MVMTKMAVHPYNHAMLRDVESDGYLQYLQSYCSAQLTKRTNLQSPRHEMGEEISRLCQGSAWGSPSIARGHCTLLHTLCPCQTSGAPCRIENKRAEVAKRQMFQCWKQESATKLTHLTGMSAPVPLNSCMYACIPEILSVVINSAHQLLAANPKNGAWPRSTLVRLHYVHKISPQQDR